MNRKVGVAELDRHMQKGERSRLDRLLSLADCAMRTGHKVSTWRAWVLHRKVPYHKIGRSIRVLESDLDRLIAESRIPALEVRNGR